MFILLVSWIHRVKNASTAQLTRLFIYWQNRSYCSQNLERLTFISSHFKIDLFHKMKQTSQISDQAFNSNFQYFTVFDTWCLRHISVCTQKVHRFFYLVLLLKWRFLTLNTCFKGTEYTVKLAKTEQNKSNITKNLQGYSEKTGRVLKDCVI